MNCTEARPLIEASVDGELDLVSQLGLEEHLHTCPECARRRDALVLRRTALREGLPRYAGPVGLAERVRSSIRAEATPAPAAERRPARLAWFPWIAPGLAAAVAVGLAVGFRWGDARARGELLMNEAVGDHVRSLQASHLSDVASTDQHTVKPWFAGKLDFAPPVVDLAAAGFPLTGGRLDRLAGRPVAALVYRRRQHSINVFIWPSGPAAGRGGASGRDGYHVQAWTQDGFSFLAVSEISPAELGQFAAAFQAANRP